jgi:dolichol-phosphate mannosyltransferase
MSLTFEPILRRFARPLRFGVVGLSGVAVNTAILWGLVSGARLPVLLASALATEVAILSNFLLNDRWTFQAEAQYSASVLHSAFLLRLLRFNGVSLAGMAITVAVLSVLIAYGHFRLLLANLFAVGTAMVWNYVVNSHWTWGGQSAVSSQQSTLTTNRDQEVTTSTTQS